MKFVTVSPPPQVGETCQNTLAYIISQPPHAGIVWGCLKGEVGPRLLCQAEVQMDWPVRVRVYLQIYFTFDQGLLEALLTTK